MKEERLIENIYNWINTTSYILCSKCGAQGVCPGNDDDAVHDFKTSGWYATEHNVWCPKCNEERQKYPKRIVKLRTNTYPKMKKSPAKKKRLAHR